MSRRVLLAASLVLATACLGPGRVTYIDSSRPAGSRSFERDIGTSTPQLGACGEAGIAQITTSTPFLDRLLFGSRRAEYTCGKAP